MSINSVVLVGRLTKDVELRYTPSAVAVSTFTLAVNRQFTNQQGEREADFPPIVAWRQLAELAANYLRKGSQCAVSGRLQTRSYENKEGRKVFVTEVVADNIQFLSPSGEKRESGGYSPSGNAADPFHDPFAGSTHIDISDDDLPF